jgi:hypothetical protein
MFQNAGAASFPPEDRRFVEVGTVPVDAIEVDLTADGLPEIVTANAGDGTVSIILNNGGFSFQPSVSLSLGESVATTVTPSSLAALDMDGDGDPDLALVADGGSGSERMVLALRNDFNVEADQLAITTPIDLEGDPSARLVVSADLDGDGDADLITINAADGGMLAGGGGAGSGGTPSAVSVLPNLLLRVPGDVDGDGVVGFEDILAVLSAWGACPPECPEDLDGDGMVGFSDLLLVLGNFS